jgi:hypothetical protein
MRKAQALSDMGTPKDLSEGEAREHLGSSENGVKGG